MIAIDRQLATDILDATDYLLDPVRGEERGFAQDCYRDLRVMRWTNVMALQEKLRGALAADGPVPLTDEEIELAGAVVECADIFEDISAGESAQIWERVGTVVAIGGGVLGILAFVI